MSSGHVVFRPHLRKRNNPTRISCAHIRRISNEAIYRAQSQQEGKNKSIRITIEHA